MPFRRAASLFLLASTLAPGFVVGADWPQFGGPNRDGLSKETGLLKSWPKEGPAKLWQAKNLGSGFCTPSIAEGKIFGLGTREGKDGLWALNEANGNELWFTPIDDARK